MEIYSLKCIEIGMDSLTALEARRLKSGVGRAMLALQALGKNPTWPRPAFRWGQRSLVVFGSQLNHSSLCPCSHMAFSSMSLCPLCFSMFKSSSPYIDHHQWI